MADDNEGGLAAAAEREPEVEVLSAELVITEKPEAMTEAEVERWRAAAQQRESLVEAAQSVVVTTEAQERDAVEFLAQLKAQKRENDATRKFLTKPLQDHVKAIIARFKPNEDALDEAIEVLNGKVLTYQAEVRRRAAAMQAKLDEERAEAEAEAERRRQAAEDAARAAREVAEQEANRRAEQARQQAEQAAAAAAKVAEELRAEMGALPKSALTYQAAHAPEQERRDAAQAELEHRAAIEAAEAAEREAEAAATAQAEAEAAEQAAREAPAVSMPEVRVVGHDGPVRSASGTASSRGQWKFEVFDLQELCRAVADGRVSQDYIQVSPELGKAVRRKDDPERSVPGVRIFQEQSLSVRSRS